MSDLIYNHYYTDIRSNYQHNYALFLMLFKTIYHFCFSLYIVKSKYKSVGVVRLTVTFNIKQLAVDLF